MTSPESIPAIVARQREFFAGGETRDLDFRVKSLEKLADEWKKREPEILEALAADLGKPDLEAYVSEYHFVLQEVRLFIKKLRRWAKPERVGSPFYFWPARSEIRREPFGVSLVIAPWNYPFQLAMAPLISSVAAGNCVVLKPSELAPATASKLAEMVESVFDSAHVTTVLGGIEVGKVVLDQRFEFIFYTGGETVGKIVAESAAEHLTPTVLELGGKCPCLLDSEIDLDVAAERIATGKWFNAGQTCLAPDFVLVPEALHDDLVSKLEANLRDWHSGSDLPDLARIVNDSHYQRLQNLAGETVIQIGTDDPETRRMAPRILPRAGFDDPAMQEEIFGPILPVIAYDDPDSTLSELQNSPSPLALYVFSKNRDFLETAAARVPSGSVCFNDLLKQATNFNLPFGGVGSSGHGRYRGKFGFEAFSYDRAVMKRYFFRDFFGIHPPYEGALEKLRKILK
ncbi:MAG: aldehyde dehydrogenase family protein [Verrucomicrobiales bacterium]|nr:aldehyde dehydrogenase family protein [Verrucomicrobiales bacterium]